MKKRLIISLLLCIGLFACHTFGQTAAGYVTDGTNDLADQNLAGANSSFQSALALQPTNQAANFLFAATRLLVLAQSPAGSNFLNQLGVHAAGRDYYDWTALPETNSEGKAEFPPGYNSGTAIAFYTNTLMPVIGAALTNLANIQDTNFQLLLPAAVTTGGAYPNRLSDIPSVTIDYGDVQVLRAMLTAAQFFGDALTANNADANLSWIETNIQANTLTIQSFFAEFPSLGVMQNKGVLADCEKAGTNAIDLYFGAANFILNDRTDANALFNLSTNDIPEEIEFQTELTNILLALTAPTQFASNNVGSTIYLAPYFDGDVSLRSLVPQFNGNAYVTDSVPDYTFGGILPDLPPSETEKLLTEKFPNYAGIYIGDYDLTDNYYYNYGSFAVYLSTNGQLTVVGYDPGDLYGQNGFTTDGSGFGVLVQATLGNGGGWQTSNSSFNAYGGFDDAGNFWGEIDYSDGESVYLSASLASPSGPFQSQAGLYSGTLSGPVSGYLYSILAPDGEIYFTTDNSGPGGYGGGWSPFYPQTGVSPNNFESIGFDGTDTYGILNTNSLPLDGTNYYTTDLGSGTDVPYSTDVIGPATIEGDYTNYFTGANGTFEMSRFFEAPPVITANLPAVQTVVLGNTTTFQVGAIGSQPLNYQWYLNGNPVPGATSDTLVANNNLWTAPGTYEIWVTVSDATGQTNSQTCFVTVTTLPADNAGIYEGTFDDSADNFGFFAGYLGTNGQLTVVGDDEGDGNTGDGTAFGIFVQATLDNGGNWVFSNSAVYASGNINNQTFNGEIAYSNGLSISLNPSLQSPFGPFQGFAGYYTGKISGSVSESAYAILDPLGDIYFTPAGSGPGGSDGGYGQLNYSFYSIGPNSFGTVDADGTDVYAILNTNSISMEGTNYYFTDQGNGTEVPYSVDAISPGNITGIYTNFFSNAHGTLTFGRSSEDSVGNPPVPPTITTNLFTGWTVGLGSSTTFYLGATGTAPLIYQWYLNGNPILHATNSTLVAGNNLWTNIGSYEVSATVADVAGATNSLICFVNVIAGTPNFAGIYIGNDMDNSNDLYDSDGYTNGAFAVYLGTSGQMTLLGQDNGDGTDDGYDFGFFIQTALVNGSFQYDNSNVNASGYIDTHGNFSAVLGYPQANEWVVLQGKLQSSLGPFQSTDGLYTGTYTGADSGTVDVIFDANGDLDLVPLNSSSSEPYGNAGNGVFGQFLNSTQFSLTSVSGTVVSGTLIPSTLVINGTYTNSDTTGGTFKVTRSGAGPSDLPPTITENLPASETVPLGNAATFSLEASGAQPMTYEWFFNGYPIVGATSSTLVASNLWITTGTNYIYATVANALGATNSQTCALTVTLETNIPTITITSPAPGELWSNSDFTVTGTASDTLGVAAVVCAVNGTIETASPNPTYNNWFAQVQLNPGSNTISAYAINDGLIYSKTNTVLMDYVVTSPLTVITNGEGTINPVYTAPLRVSQPLTLTATGINGFKFVSWYDGTNEPLAYYTNNATMSLTMSNGLVVEANFVDGNKPYLKITNASPGMIWSNETFTVMGVATDDEAVASVNYSFNDGPYTNNAATNGIQWSAPLPLVAGTNEFSVYAQATNGNISATDTVDIVYLATNLLTVQTSGKGTISPDYSNSWLYVGRNYSMTATPASGFKFINWTAATNPASLPAVVSLAAPNFALYSTNPTVMFTMATGLVMQANFKDLNAPYLKITNMLSQLVTNSGSFTVMGVATDDEQMTFVTYSLNGAPTNAVSSSDGWTNWSQYLPLEAGTNLLSVYATATNGNTATDRVDIVSISTNRLTIQISGRGTISPNYSNALLDAGVNYRTTATPASGFKFINWTGTTNGANGPFVLYGTNSAVTFMMQTDLVMQANFKDLNPPYLRITNILSRLVTSNTTFTAIGVATDDEQMTFVTYSLNGSPTNEVFSSDAWTNWSQTLALEAGTNVFSVYATATNGNMATDTVDIVSISTNRLTIQISGKGTISPNYSNAWLDAGENYTMTATPASGFKFINWTADTNPALLAAISLPPTLTLYSTNSKVTFMMETGLVMQANFKDLNPPYLNITNPVSKILITNASSYTVMGVATDDEEVATVNCTLNGAAASPLAISNNIAGWQALLPLTEGTNIFSAYAVATNGNLSTTDTVTIVRQPTITIFPIATNQVITNPQGQIAFDGSNYLVVYQTKVNGNGVETAQFVSTNGELLGAPVALNPGGANDDAPWLDFDGTNYLVAWEDNSAFAVDGAFVSPSGTVSPVMQLSDSTTVEEFGSIVYGDGVYFLMWPDKGTTPDSIRGAIISPSGTNVSGDFLIGTNGSENEVGRGTAAFDGTNFLAVWSSATGDMKVMGRLISTTGTFASAPFEIYTNSTTAGTTVPCVVFDGTNYLVLFNTGITSPSASASGFHILGRFVTTGAGVLTNQVTLTADSGPQIIPDGDFDGINYLISWNQGFNIFAGNTSATINGRFFNFRGSATTAEFPIFTTQTGARVPVFAPVLFDGSKFVLVTGFGQEIGNSLSFTNCVIYGAFVSP